jgi:nucleoside-diphosphate-sugar epimerase
VFDLVAGHDEVYHVAALQNYLEPTMAQFTAVNVHGTEHIMAAALEHDVDKVVYTSSQVTVDEHMQERIDERFRHSDHFNTGYSLTKYKGEKVAFEYGARGLDVTTVHPTLIYGPREVNNLLGLVRSYVEPPVRFKGFVDTLFKFVYVDDVVQGHVGAMKRGRPGERYLLGGEERSIGEFLRLVDEYTGVDKPSITVPKPLVRFGAYRVNPILERFGLSLPVSEGQVYAMEFDSKVDSSKARRELGVETTPLERGLERTLEWYCREGYLSLDRPIARPERELGEAPTGLSETSRTD